MTVATRARAASDQPTSENPVGGTMSNSPPRLIVAHSAMPCRHSQAL